MRNTHVLTLSLQPKKEGEKSTPIHIMRHNIDAMVPHDKGTTILMSSGVAYEVVEKSTDVINKCKAVGVMNEVM